MPRAARKISTTGIYHIMIRGINREEIFNDKIDKNALLKILKQVKTETNYELYAYCIMNNHAHFLLKENDSPISLIMKKICGRYGLWYNYQHSRVGHLFQDRFKSECVESDSYFIAVLKYILNNPVKGNIVVDPGDYEWSSYHEYLSKSILTDTSFFLENLHNNTLKAREIFIDELKKEGMPIRLSMENIRRTDSEAKEIINIEIKKQNIKDVLELDLEERIYFIKSLKAKGISNRQITSFTNLSKYKIIGI